MQPSSIAYRNTRYNFGTFCRINQRNSAFSRGYLYRATIDKKSYYKFVDSCNATLGKGSLKYSMDWHRYETDTTKFTSWMCYYKRYEVFFKEYEDFEQAKLHYALTNG